MISKTLLTRKGSIDTILALSDGITLTTAEAAELMDVADGTARTRLEDLAGEGLVEADADLRNGSAVKVYTITDDGMTLAEGLANMLTNADGDDYEV
jgi:predicted ArsR family transcriptional regulator